MMGPFFSFMFLSNPEFSFLFITKNLIITYKLSTIEGFYHKMSDSIVVLVFLSFCHSPKKIVKEKKN